MGGNILKDKIWVNGCFDILHHGHLDLLEYAATLGDLYVGIDSDKRVSMLKGSDRPINKEDFRYRLICSLSFVKSVFVFNTENELIELIDMVNPKHLVIGEDYMHKRVVGGENRSIIFFTHRKGLSTTNTIEKIKGL